jgi:hypothetical protein
MCSFNKTELKMTIANELPVGLVTEDEILGAAFNLMKMQLGSKTARYYFHYCEDYPSDLLSEYRYLQQQNVEV